MANASVLSRLLRFIRTFLPFNLIFSQLKFNLVAVIYWIFLFLIVSDNLGYSFGIPILFYSPEYLGSVSPLSFGLLGFALGGFIMGFNTYSYIKLGPKYPFFVTVYQPFIKFCKNNSILPLLFIGYYIYKMALFQAQEEFASSFDIFTFALSFIGGISLFVVLSTVYFFPISKRNRIEMVTSPEEEENDQPIESVIHNTKTKWYQQLLRNKHKTYIYLGRGFQFARSRSIKHIEQDLIEKIYARNKINTSIFELLTILIFIILGLFSGFRIFETPAGASVILLLTIVLMLFSALQSWFGKWTYALLIIFILSINYLSTHTRYFTFKNYAYGLDYESENRPEYSIASITHNMDSDSSHDQSLKQYIETLENWKKQTGERRPKLIILNTSGGGSRSALWTLGVLQKLDKELNGKLQKSMQFITGASGGMVGASYFRELVLRFKEGEITDLYSPEFRENIGKDLLNKLSFSASTNDIFFRYQSMNYNNFNYPIDRGYAFEQQLHENTKQLMDHSLGYYLEYERNGEIPTMVFSPTIVNDGRRLLISAQNLCFLCTNKMGKGSVSKSYENVDYQSFFESLNPNEVRFSSVMRTSSTFPFVMPMVTMPTKPEVQLMDAGIRDNYGGKVTINYLTVLNDWIKKNTSGVIILQIRDTKKILNNELYHPVSFIDKLTMPFGNVYKNFPKTQDYDQEQLFKVGTQQFTFPVDLIVFNLRENKSDRISLSWHLTSQEKLKIDTAFHSSLNQNALLQMKRLLNH